MNLLSKLFGKKNQEEQEAKGNVEEYVSLIRVYLQAVMAINMGITNMNFVPDLARFKRLLSIPTQGGRLGVAEKARAKKILTQYYGISDSFFTEIEQSVKRSCKNINQVNTYFFQFQGFSNDLLLMISNVMSWKIRIPSMFKKTLYNAVEKSVEDILTKSDWTTPDMFRTSMGIRKYKDTLGFSQAWITEFSYNLIVLAKKEKQPAQEQTETKK